MFLRTSFSSLALAGLLSLPATQDSRNEDIVKATPIPRSQVLAEMTWLAGDWTGDYAGGRFEAYYSTCEGGRVLSYSRLFQDDRQVFHEFEVFEGRDNAVYLQPFPGGKPAEPFLLREHDREARRAVFENPENDFPSRITYERAGEDRLVIALTDPHGGNERVDVYDLRRK